MTILEDEPVRKQATRILLEIANDKETDSVTRVRAIDLLLVFNLI
jgi:hypothetical protein